MKKSLIILMILSFSFVAFSQTDEDSARQSDEIKTIFRNDVSHGGYIGITCNYSQIDNKDAIAVGGRIGWIIDHHFTIGFAGYGFVNDVYIDDVFESEVFNLGGGYGGLLLEPIIAPKFPIHLSFPIIIGAGGVNFLDHKTRMWDEDNDRNGEETDVFFVVEPGIELELNMVKFMRIAIGGSYRFTDAIDLKGVDKDILKGFSGGITLKFGKF